MSFYSIPENDSGSKSPQLEFSENVLFLLESFIVHISALLLFLSAVF